MINRNTVIAVFGLIVAAPNLACSDDEVTCASDQRVAGNSCVPCPPGTTNLPGDNMSGPDTDCDPVLCQTNERVRANECILCPAPASNEAGDDASGQDTECRGPAEVWSTAPLRNEVRIRDAETLTLLKTLSGAATLLNYPTGIAVDYDAEEVFIVNAGDNSITVYSLDAAGDIAPLRRIAGPQTGLSFIQSSVWGFSQGAIYVDANNGELGVGSQFEFLVFPLGATGNVPPTRRGVTFGISIAAAFDATHEEVLVTVETSTGAHRAVGVFERTASASTPPLRTLVADCDLCTVPGIALDVENNELWLATVQDGVIVFDRTATGSLASLSPRRQFQTGIAIAIAVEPTGTVGLLDGGGLDGGMQMRLLNATSLAVLAETSLDTIERDLAFAPFR